MGFIKFSKVLDQNVQIHAYKYIQQIAEEMISEAKDIIKFQKYEWKPLSLNYLEYKINKGLDTRILLATHFYYDHITWGITDKKIWWGVEDVVHDPSGLELRVLARIHEYGTSTIPARPLWRPLLEKYLNKKKQFAHRYLIEIIKAVKRARKELQQKNKGKFKVKLG